jgi:hypothetical protein
MITTTVFLLTTGLSFDDITQRRRALDIVDSHLYVLTPNTRARICCGIPLFHSFRSYEMLGGGPANVALMERRALEWLQCVLPPVHSRCSPMCVLQCCVVMYLCLREPHAIYYDA